MTGVWKGFDLRSGMTTTSARSHGLPGNPIDRDYLSRDRPGLFAELLAENSTRILPVWNGRALSTSDDSARLALFSPAHISSIGPLNHVTMVYLGRSVSPFSVEPVGTPIVAVDLADAAALTLAPDDHWRGLRDLAPLLDGRDSGLLVEAVALANWHASHRFSPRTGEPLIAQKAGWVLSADGDSAEVFPRTDPAVIVAVVDGQDRLLLGSNAMWQVDRYSLLAGFVEPGESLEEAVSREIFEESGIRVIDPVYLGSQPWPFPASLMVGFGALLDPDAENALIPDGTEILDVRWFTRTELREESGLILPGPASIARRIIDSWVALG